MVGDEWGRKDPRLMVELEGNRRSDRIQVTQGRQNEILGGSAALYRSRMGQSFRNRREGGETLVTFRNTWAPLEAQTAKNPPAMQEIWVWKIPQRREWLPGTPVFLPGEVHGQRSLVGYCPWGHKDSLCVKQETS